MPQSPSGSVLEIIQTYGSRTEPEWVGTHGPWAPSRREGPPVIFDANARSAGLPEGSRQKALSERISPHRACALTANVSSVPFRLPAGRDWQVQFRLRRHLVARARDGMCSQSDLQADEVARPSSPEWLTPRVGSYDPEPTPGTIHRVLARVRLRKAPSEASSTSATPMLKVAPHGPATSGASLASSGLSGVGRDPPSHAYARRISAVAIQRVRRAAASLAKAAGVKRRASGTVT